MAARFRFSAESAAALGMGGLSADELTQRLGFPAGVKVTSVKEDGGGLVLNLSGGGVEGDVTGSFSLLSDDRIRFHGFEPVAADPAPAPAAMTTEG